MAKVIVLTHQPPEVPPKQDERLTFTFVTDGVESAVTQATAAAGDKSVQVVGGVSVVQPQLPCREVAGALWTRRPGPSGRYGRLGSRAPQVPDP